MLFETFVSTIFMNIHEILFDAFLLLLYYNDNVDDVDDGDEMIS